MKKRNLIYFAFALAIMAGVIFYSFDAGKYYQMRHQEPEIHNHYLTDIIIDTIYKTDTLYIR